MVRLAAQPLLSLPLQMPRLWLDYCQFLMDQGRVTHTRRTFDRALRALPITQHSRIWPLYLRFLRSHPLPETAVRGYRRFLKVSPLKGQDGARFRQVGQYPRSGLSKNALTGGTVCPDRQEVGTWLVETHRVLFMSSVFNFQRVCEQPLYVRHWDTGSEDSVAKTVPACMEFSVSPGRQMLVT